MHGNIAYLLGRDRRGAALARAPGPFSSRKPRVFGNELVRDWRRLSLTGPQPNAGGPAACGGHDCTTATFTGLALRGYYYESGHVGCTAPGQRDPGSAVSVVVDHEHTVDLF